MAPGEEGDNLASTAPFHTLECGLEGNTLAGSLNASHSSFQLPTTPSSRQAMRFTSHLLRDVTLLQTESSTNTTQPSATECIFSDALPQFESIFPSGHELPPDSFDHAGDSTNVPGSRALRAISPGTAHDLQARTAQMIQMLTCTPKNKHSTRDDAAGQSLASHAQSMVRSLGGVPIASDGWVLQLLVDCQVQSKSTITKWMYTRAKVGRGMKNTKGESKKKSTNDPPYANGHWTKVPKTTKSLKERDLYQPFVELISSVFVKFQVRGRTIVDNHATYLPHHEEEHRTAPDLVIGAVGPSFEAPSNGEAVGYSNMATFIDMKLDSELNKEAHKEQLVVYVRQIFAHQPNRWFVRCLLLSENRVRLYQFDRAGAQITSMYNIHSEPELFIRVILAVCTDKDDRFLGLDDSLRWDIGSNGRKKAGYLRTLAPDRAKDLVLLDPQPIAHHRHIRGSATVLWSACDPDQDTEHIVKDSWSSQGRTPEWKLLERAAKAGVVGVCRMAWYEECRMSIEFIRCEHTVSLYFNRKQFRIVMEKYGLEIQNFTSVLQVLQALRDAISAHMGLHKIGILHRDISNKTILLGREGAPPGWRGVLIDLSLAFDQELQADCTISEEPTMGSHFFRSTNILEYLTELSEEKVPPAHDYLDDLESFFCVLCYLFFLFNPDGTERDPTDKARNVVKGWDSENADDALPPKSMLFNPTCGQKRLAALQVSKSWGKACKTLFQGYHGWICKIQAERRKLIDEYKDKQQLEGSEEEAIEEDQANSSVNSEPDGSEHGDVSRSVATDEGLRSPEDSTNPTHHGETNSEYHESLFAPLLKQCPAHYDAVLHFFDKAILSLGGLTTNPAPHPVQDIPLVPSLANGKRRLSVAARDNPERPVKSTRLAP